MDSGKDFGEGGSMSRLFPIDDIHISKKRRAPDMARVSNIAESIGDVGLMNPPAVCIRNEVVLADGEVCDAVPVLIYGHHRLLALKQRGEVAVECVVYEVDDLHAELMEISENLHRSELTALERDEHVARWIELAKIKREQDAAVLRQVDAKPGRPEGGVRAAARELKISEADARRAVIVAGLSTEAKAAAVESGLADNRTALLEAAREAEPEKQIAAIVKWDARREAAAAKATLERRRQKEAKKTAIVGRQEDEEASLIDFYTAWEGLPEDRRRTALIEIGADRYLLEFAA
ncbi:ParB/RepB/Spo0J family partition protein [Shinella sp.]|uniref:ParB/RepB/Spo0J family partition protein n=1 Tax=Shinella sp. TaxID=1870904 RepID=UPI0029B34784|nr:ParB/RepB/Spo0J family partition protein [Shinella sp.]MDX3976156.1 ParB/RepB/Spo0J family partition protein [Shinella sp.]